MGAKIVIREQRLEISLKIEICDVLKALKVVSN